MLLSKRCVLAHHTGGYPQCDGSSTPSVYGWHTDGLSPFTSWRCGSEYCRLPRWLFFETELLVENCHEQIIDTKRDIVGSLKGRIGALVYIIRLNPVKKKPAGPTFLSWYLAD